MTLTPAESESAIEFVTFKSVTETFDAFTVIGKNEAMSKCIYYQQKLYKKIIESADMIYEQLAILKQTSI